MQRLLIFLRCLGQAGLVVVAIPALAGGGAGNQRPRFLGAGLDEYQPAPGLSGGVYVTQGVQEFILGASSFPPSGTFPPPSAIGTTRFTLNSLTCTIDPSNKYLARCNALVNLQ